MSKKLNTDSVEKLEKYFKNKILAPDAVVKYTHCNGTLGISARKWYRIKKEFIFLVKKKKATIEEMERNKTIIEDACPICSLSFEECKLKSKYISTTCCCRRVICTSCYIKCLSDHPKNKVYIHVYTAYTYTHI